MDALNPVDLYLQQFLGVLDAAIGYLQPPIFGFYNFLMLLGIAALSVFLLRGGREYFERLGPRVLYLGALGFLLSNFTAITSAIGNTFVSLGLAAGGGTMAADMFWNPGAMATYGHEAAAPIRAAAAEVSVLQSGGIWMLFWLGVAGFLLKLSYDIAAVAVMVAIIAFHLGGVAAFVLAATAALPRLAWMAAGAFGFVISAGVGLFAYALLISVVAAITQDVFTNPAIGHDLRASVAITTAIVNFGLMLLGPTMIRSVMAGVANMGLGAAATAAGTAVMTLAAPVAGGMLLARGAPAAIQGARHGIKQGITRIGLSRVPGAPINAPSVGAAAPTAAVGAPAGWNTQRALPSPASRGITAVHAARALVPDGTDQGGGMMAPANPERS